MYRISLKDISLQVYLGVYDFEQAATQTVTVDVSFDFLEMPAGCISDQVEDVICYAMVNDVLKKTATKKRYHLIEHLGFELIQSLKKMLTIPADIRLSLHKEPPLNNIQFATFTMEAKWQG